MFHSVMQLEGSQVLNTSIEIIIMEIIIIKKIITVTHSGHQQRIRAWRAYRYCLK